MGEGLGDLCREADDTVCAAPGVVKELD